MKKNITNFMVLTIGVSLIGLLILMIIEFMVGSVILFLGSVAIVTTASIYVACKQIIN